MTATGAGAGNDLVPAGPAGTVPDGAVSAPDGAVSAPDGAVSKPEPVGVALPPELVAGDQVALEAASPRAAEPPRRPGGVLPRAGIAIVLAAASAVGAALLAARGVRTDAFPPFVAGAQSTPITRYSGPWLTAAAGAALLAALLLLAAVVDLVRWYRSRTASAGAG